MIFGSFLGGFTCEGEGAVAFPVFSFGIALYLKNFVFKLKGYEKINDFHPKDALLISAVGVFGGIFSSIIGTGIHFITFSFVTLFYRLDEKVATSTSIIIMASDSIFGFIFRKFIIQQFNNQAIEYWMLCIPVVALFAPLGAIACSKVSRVFITKFLLFLILCELASTILIFEFSTFTVVLSIIIIIFSFVVYISLFFLSNKFIKTKFKS